MLKILKGQIKTERELWNDIKEKSKSESPLHKLNVPHASINRITNTTEGGQLYNEDTHYVAGKFSVLVFFFNHDYAEKVEASLRFTQLGGNRTTGMGYSEVNVEDVNGELEEFIKQPTQKLITLSPTLKDTAYDLSESYYELFPLLSPVDNFYSVVSPAIWKRRRIFITKGSLIKVRENKPFYGELAEALTNRDTGKRIYQYGLAFPLYVREKDEA
jgi:CRISPR-associated protein Csm4